MRDNLFDVTLEDAAELFLKEGRKEMANCILDLLEVTQDPKILKVYINGLLKDDSKKINDLKDSFKKLRSKHVRD